MYSYYRWIGLVRRRCPVLNNGCTVTSLLWSRCFLAHKNGPRHISSFFFTHSLAGLHTSESNLKSISPIPDTTDLRSTISRFFAPAQRVLFTRRKYPPSISCTPTAHFMRAASRTDLSLYLDFPKQRDRYLESPEFRSEPRTAIKIVLLLCLLNCLVFYQWDWAMDDAVTRQDPTRLYWLLDNAQASLHNLAEGRWWVLLTSMFSHQNASHLLINCVATYSFMTPVVFRYGVLRSLFIYVCAGFIANVFTLERQFQEARRSTSLSLHLPNHVWQLLQSKNHLVYESPLQMMNPDTRDIYTIASTNLPAGWTNGCLGSSAAVYSMISMLTCAYPRAQFYLLFVFPFRASTLLPLDLLVESVLAYTHWDRRLSVAFDAHVVGALVGLAANLLVMPRTWKLRVLRFLSHKFR
ncbi:rhomboid family protease [Schizosaccharomyces japonicus yFS275]|uniref:Rhomboid family protease n=1 Tax=Schizosaccharomyces japonicus (strain yFS275 / FY16936) TaxID=402676 RepID=B6K5D7_SCHJY|nr:rhomboid family protease [Schizosaccharomyces japonicus yFS275]EEB08741.1 rhomboid family protease [Schizosaccharomyces japonicus yFS275]